jgi:hypothetical protein
MFCVSREPLVPDLFSLSCTPIDAALLAFVAGIRAAELELAVMS